MNKMLERQEFDLLKSKGYTWQNPFELIKIFEEKIALLFIDGGHSLETAINDYECWKNKICSGGLLVIHDVFPNPQDG